MDELFLHLTNSSAKEQRQYSVGLQKHCGSPGATATVFLCTTADGNMLPPLLVLKVDRVIISVRKQKNCKRFIYQYGLNGLAKIDLSFFFYFYPQQVESFEDDVLLDKYSELTKGEVIVILEGKKKAESKGNCAEESKHKSKLTPSPTTCCNIDTNNQIKDTNNSRDNDKNDNNNNNKR